MLRGNVLGKVNHSSREVREKRKWRRAVESGNRELNLKNIGFILLEIKL